VATFEHPREKGVELVGWIDKASFMRQQYPLELDGVRQCVLEQQSLYPFDSLCRLVSASPSNGVQ
jgi:hypothetical protein